MPGLTSPRLENGVPMRRLSGEMPLRPGTVRNGLLWGNAVYKVCLMKEAARRRRNRYISSCLNGAGVSPAGVSWVCLSERSQGWVFFRRVGIVGRNNVSRVYGIKCTAEGGSSNAFSPGSKGLRRNVGFPWLSECSHNGYYWYALLRLSLGFQ